MPHATRVAVNGEGFDVVGLGEREGPITPVWSAWGLLPVVVVSFGVGAMIRVLAGAVQCFLHGAVESLGTALDVSGERGEACAG